MADILTESGFKVEGPKHITYYLVQKSSPVEWGISPGIENEANALFQVLKSIFIPNDKWTRRTFDKTKNRLRIHFGGAAIFQKNGIVTVQ